MAKENIWGEKYPLSQEGREREMRFETDRGFVFVYRRDLYNSIKIYTPKRFKEYQDREALVAEATAHFMGNWMLETYPILHGFAGYDHLRFDLMGDVSQLYDDGINLNEQ